METEDWSRVERWFYKSSKGKWPRDHTSRVDNGYLWVQLINHGGIPGAAKIKKQTQNVHACVPSHQPFGHRFVYCLLFVICDLSHPSIDHTHAQWLPNH